MAHRTFFSFYYDEDIWRASNVRNSGALNKDDIEFIDASQPQGAQNVIPGELPVAYPCRSAQPP